jgi:glycosyltransferase involved in cell wall biosynthesis
VRVNDVTVKILHIYKDYFPTEGGIENHIKLLAETQAGQGHAVTVLVTSRDRHTHIEQINGVRVVYAGRLVSISSTPVSLALFRLLGSERADIAHLQFPYPWGELANLLAGRARKTVMTYQSDIVRQRYLKIAYAPIMNQVLRRMDAILATSPNYIESSPVLNRFRNKCIAVPMGINTAPFLNVPIQAAAELRAHLLASAPAGTVLLLYVGVLRYYKGLNYLLEALPSIANARLAIVGRGPMEQVWKAQVQTLGLSDRVTFVGEIANRDLPPYYAACDIFVLPSSERSEAFGLVQLEAMASRKPVVTTELGTGTSFVTRDGVNGIVVQPRNPGALAQAIMRLIGDQALREALGAAGRARVLAEFTVDKMLARILEVYQKVSAGR